MRTLCSRVSQSGHVVLVRIPDGASVTATFADQPGSRDLTPFVADLLLTGALDAAEKSDTGRPDPEQVVQAATVTYTEAQLQPGQVGAPATFTWMHLPTREGGDFPPEDVLAVLAAGLVAELTSGVATEAATAPDDPAGIDRAAADQ